MDHRRAARTAVVSAGRTRVPGARRPGVKYASWSFDARDPRSAREGREMVRKVLEQWGLSECADLGTDLELIAAELIANVHEHTGVPAGEAELKWGGGILTIWVRDRGEGMPRPLSAPADDGTGWDWTGWGLPLVQTLAAEAGGSVLIQPDPDGGGKSVGVRLPVPAGRGAGTGPDTGASTGPGRERSIEFGRDQ